MQAMPDLLAALRTWLSPTADAAPSVGTATVPLLALSYQHCQTCCMLLGSCSSPAEICYMTLSLYMTDMNQSTTCCKARTIPLQGQQHKHSLCLSSITAQAACGMSQKSC